MMNRPESKTNKEKESRKQSVGKIFLKMGSGKMLLVRIVENNKIDAYFRAG